ncbi:MAG: hypothetical protein KH760_04935 [Clostridiales bacterium]|nr:hypothetical protein [Clostridiales bacterium]
MEQRIFSFYQAFFRLIYIVLLYREIPVFSTFSGDFAAVRTIEIRKKNLGFSIALAYGGKEVLRHADFALFEVNGHGNMAARRALAGTDVTNEDGEKTMEIYGI